jgi:hypothetical protein
MDTTVPSHQNRPAFKGKDKETDGMKSGIFGQLKAKQPAAQQPPNQKVPRAPRVPRVNMMTPLTNDNNASKPVANNKRKEEDSRVNPKHFKKYIPNTAVSTPANTAANTVAYTAASRAQRFGDTNKTEVYQQVRKKKTLNKKLTLCYSTKKVVALNVNKQLPMV